MDNTLSAFRRWAVPWLLMTCLIQAMGCSRNPALGHNVNTDDARRALESVLTAWRDGATSESLQAKEPPMVVQDFDWTLGAKLESFEILGPGEAFDANLHCQVKLTLVDSQGQRTEKTVKYMIGTSPRIAVFRSLEP